MLLSCVARDDDSNTIYRSDPCCRASTPWRDELWPMMGANYRRSRDDVDVIGRPARCCLHACQAFVKVLCNAVRCNPVCDPWFGCTPRCDVVGRLSCCLGVVCGVVSAMCWQLHVARVDGRRQPRARTGGCGAWSVSTAIASKLHLYCN